MRHDVVVVGGGLAGLTAASRLARAGRSVTLYERAQEVGGRARTQNDAGYAFNLGPHALYRSGAALRALRDLGVPVAGRSPPVDGLALNGASLDPFPTTASGLLGSRFLGWGARAEYAWVLGRVLTADASAWRGTPVSQWLDTMTDPALRAWMAALVRVSSYANHPEHQDAGAALAQLRRSFAGVLYLDGGWGPLVQALRALATAAGVQVRTAAAVTAADAESATVDGVCHSAAAVLLALPLPAARALLPDLPRATPVLTACLDLALSRLPIPDRTFVLGVTEPVYLSVHSATAKLAPDGGAMVHVARYLGPGEHGDEASLEALMDRVQPGWREVVVARRYLPALTTASALHGADAPRHPGTHAGIWLAGDWVGDEGMLADASMASAEVAAQGILGTGYP